MVVASEDQEEGGEQRSFIPTNESGQGKPAFKLLTQEDLAREIRAAQATKAAAADAFDDVIVVEGNEDKPLTKDIPRDDSGKNQAGFRLPLREEARYVVTSFGYF